MGSTCPARLEVTIHDGRLSVKFFKTHVGHGRDLEHIHLSRVTRAEIAVKMKQGESFERILHEIHSGALSTVDPQRALRIKRKDLHNIFRDFRIGSTTNKRETASPALVKVEDEEVQLIDQRKREESIQQMRHDLRRNCLKVNELQECIVKANERFESTFDHYEIVPPTTISKQDGISSGSTSCQVEMAVSDPRSYFAEQHLPPTQEVRTSSKVMNYDIPCYEETATEDSIVSDHEVTIEKDHNGFPISYCEDTNSGNSDVINKIEPSNLNKERLKTCDIRCPDCSQIFTKRKNLYAHMRNIHKLIGIRDPVSAHKCRKKEVCSLCGKNFINKSSVRRHRQKVHKEGVVNSHVPRIRCPVPNCLEASSSYSHLRVHLNISHQKLLVMEEMHFSSEREFLRWKDCVQASTVSFYALDTSRKVMKDGTVKKYYNCHRSHSYKSTGRNIRKLKSSGSIKIGRTCPSRLEVLVNNGELDVKFWKTHLGHAMDVGHTTLSKTVRIEIAEMLKQGATFEQVLDAARNGRLHTNQSQRTPLIKRKDLHNICRDFHISLSSMQVSSEIVNT